VILRIGLAIAEIIKLAWNPGMIEGNLENNFKASAKPNLKQQSSPFVPKRLYLFVYLVILPGSVFSKAELRQNCCRN